MDPETVNRIKVSTWTPESPGSYPARIVLWKREDGEGHPDGQHPYCSHIQVNRHEEGTRPFFHGNYDMTWEEAEADFAERCRQYAVREDQGGTE